MLDGDYPQITMSLHIRRKPLYYMYTVVAPTLVLCIMTLFTFLLPCDNGAKVGIGLTVFLSLYVLQLAIAENIPDSNSLPLIGKWPCQFFLYLTYNAYIAQEPFVRVYLCIIWMIRAYTACTGVTRVKSEFKTHYS